MKSSGHLFKHIKPRLYLNECRFEFTIQLRIIDKGVTSLDSYTDYLVSRRPIRKGQKRTNYGGNRIEKFTVAFSKFSLSIHEQFVNDWTRANFPPQLLIAMFSMLKALIFFKTLYKLIASRISCLLILKCI